MTKQYPVCRYCGTDDVLVDAYVQWNPDAQQWEVASTYDVAFCPACDGDTRLEWKELTT